MCFARSRSSRSPPLAPPAPQRQRCSLPPCSSASQLLRRCQTSHGRASSATAPRLPDADQDSTLHLGCWPTSETSRFPNKKRLHMPGSVTSPDRPGARDLAPVHVAFHIRNCVGIRDDKSFAVRWLAYALPYRRFADIRGRPRTARGRCGSLLLHRKGLAPSTPCRFRRRTPKPFTGADFMHRSKITAYSITSSARSRIAVGSSMPIALAVLRLTTSWNFTACSIGRSSGFAPLIIFAT
jgi:hypothetical protein